MNIAFVGCGYVADLYAKTLSSHPELRLVGAHDLNVRNLDAFLGAWPTRKYPCLDELLSQPAVELVLNLTNPRSHDAVTERCLDAGKHVYSEKPLAMTPEKAVKLAHLATRRNVVLSSAPCSVLSDTAQTLWKAIREHAVGKVRLVYANLEDGMIAPSQSPWTWKNGYGVEWPAKDEFEVGCTYEHAGYVLTWLAAFFGPAVAVTSFASCQIPDKGIPVDARTPDFTAGCIEFADGVVARVTCGIVGPKDKSLTVVGDDGVLFVGNVRNDYGPVMVRKYKRSAWQSRVEQRTQPLQRWLEGRIAWPGCDALFQKTYPSVSRSRGGVVSSSKPVDFMRGPAELAEAVRDQRPSRLSAEFGAHIVEIVEALQYPERFAGRKSLLTTFAPMQPLPWAV